MPAPASPVQADMGEHRVGTRPERVQDLTMRLITGEPLDLSHFDGRVLLAVNVASRCGFTPQYAGLQRLQERFQGAGLTVLGFPCNQFLFQEPGSAEAILSFCSATYGVTFPIFEKINVKGSHRHPIYELLSGQADDSGLAGEVKWNFEKFLIGRAGKPQRRFRSRVEPESPVLLEAIEELLQ